MRVALPLVLLSACSGSASSSLPPDASPPDARAEASTTGDGGSSRSDAGNPDARPVADAASEDGSAAGDAGSQVLAPNGPRIEELRVAVEELTFEALDWSHERCAAELATDVTSLPSLRWVQAGDDASGCELGGPATPQEAGGYGLLVVPDHTGIHPAAVDPDERRVWVAWGSDGAPRWAMRLWRECWVNTQRTSAETCHVLSTRKEGTNYTFDARVKCGDPLGDAPVVSTPDQGGRTAVSDSFVHFGPWPYDETVSFRRSDGPSASPTTLAVGGVLRGLVARGSTALGRVRQNAASGGHGTLMRSEDGAPWETLHNPAPAHVVSLNATETQLIWLQSNDDSPRNLPAELWLAPWPTTGAPLEPRFVANLDNVVYDDGFAASDAFFAHIDRNGIDLFRLSDGMQYAVPIPAELDLDYNRVWLDDVYVSYGVSDRDSEQWSLVRCRLADVAP